MLAAYYYAQHGCDHSVQKMKEVEEDRITDCKVLTVDWGNDKSATGSSWLGK